MPNKQNNKNVVKLAGGLAVAGTAAAAAYYFFVHPKAKKHRQELGDFSLKAKAEILKKISTIKKISKPAYEEAVSQIMGKYKKLKTAAPKELLNLEKELKSMWNPIAGNLSQKAGKQKTSAKKMHKTK